MPIRRLLYRWQLAAIVVLPLWLFVGWGLFGTSAWGILGLLLVAPVTLIALGVVALIIGARPSVRETKALDWRDAAVVLPWHAAIVGVGFFGAWSTFFGALAVALAIAAFWISLWQLLREGSRRMQAAYTEFERTARDAGGGGRLPPEDGGEFLVIRENRD